MLTFVLQGTFVPRRSVVARGRSVCVRPTPLVKPFVTPRMVAVQENDVVVWKTPYGGFNVGVVTKVEGTSADVAELEEYDGNLWVKMSGKPGYEPTSKMKPISATYDNGKDGYKIDASQIESAKSALGAGEGSTAAPPEKKDYSQDFTFIPTKSEALGGAGVSVLGAALLLAGYVSAQRSFGGSATSGGSQNVLNTFALGVGLSLFAGISLFILAFTGARKD